MTTLNIETSACTNQLAESEECARASANRRRDRSADDAELGKRTDSEDQTRAKSDVDPVREPQRAHRDCCITSTAKDRVDHEEHYDADVTGQHHTRERRTMFDYPRRATHRGKKFWSQRCT